jgi:hypothetical protein
MANTVSGHRIISLDSYDAYLISKIEEHGSFDPSDRARTVTAALLLLSRAVESSIEKKKKEATEALEGLETPVDIDPF